MQIVNNIKKRVKESFYKLHSMTPFGFVEEYFFQNSSDASGNGTTSTDASGNGTTSTDASGNGTSTDASGNGTSPPTNSRFSIVLRTLKIVGNIFLILLACRLVTNEFIVEPVFIRVSVFVIMFIASFIFPLTMPLTILYYIGLIIVRYINNHLAVDKSQIKPLLHPMFAILPISTTPAETDIGKLFKYPFFYPKTKEDKELLKTVVEKYYADLRSSVVDINDLEGRYPILGDSIKKFYNNLYTMHNLTIPSSESNANTSNTNTPISKSAGNNTNASPSAPQNNITPPVSNPPQNNINNSEV